MANQRRKANAPARGAASGSRPASGGGSSAWRWVGKTAIYGLALFGGATLGLQGYDAAQQRLTWLPPLPSRGETARRQAGSLPAPIVLTPDRSAPGPKPAPTRESEPRRRRRVSRAEAPPPRPAEPSEVPVAAQTAPSDPSAARTPPPSGNHVPPVEISRGAGNRPEVALTFDAGADWKPVKQILEALEAEGLRCTFFVTGEWVKRNPRTTRLIVEKGHELGNHSWDHAAFTTLSDSEIVEQLRRTEEVVQEVTGRSTRPYFRPPLGDRDLRVRTRVGDEGYYTIYWTLDSRDSVDKGITADQIRDRVLGKSAAGSIVLLHCGSQATADALPEILRGFKSRGLTPVPLSRLLAE